MKSLLKHGDICNALYDEVFIYEIRKILDKFGMNARNSQLVSRNKFHQTLKKSASLFDEVEKGNYTIENIYFKYDVFDVIKKIYDVFSEGESLSYSGGFVIASKTMHFIMPELFIMIDRTHIGVSLYNIDDYMPYITDGKSWKEVIPNYSGKKANPSPRGGGGKYWDSERYCIALMYYKRILLEWLESNKSDVNNFLKLDDRSDLITRIIDKGLW